MSAPTHATSGWVYPKHLEQAVISAAVLADQYRESDNPFTEDMDNAGLYLAISPETFSTLRAAWDDYDQRHAGEERDGSLTYMAYADGFIAGVLAARLALKDAVPHG